MSLLLSRAEASAGERCRTSQLRDEIVTLLLAGHETTANALAWTWYLLARHPEVEARLHAEIDAVLGSGPPAECRRCAGAARSRAWCSQSRCGCIRLPGCSARVAVEEHECADTSFPPDRWSFCQPVGRSPEQHVTFPNPSDSTRPVARGSTRARPRFSYFPFGGGSRGCMGEAFAWMEGVLLLAVFAQRWRFRLLDESSHPRMQPALDA